MKPDYAQRFEVMHRASDAAARPVAAYEVAAVPDVRFASRPLGRA